MASKLRAGSGFPYILKEDRGEVTDPQFMLRVLSADDSDTISDLRTQFISTKDAAVRRELRSAMLAMCVLSVQCTTEPIASVLTEVECWELIGAAIDGTVLTTEERKKYVSPLPFATAASASDAEVNVSTK